jgi:hypothetical protein
LSDGEGALVVLDLQGGFGNIDGDVVNEVGVGGFSHGFSRSCRGAARQNKFMGLWSTALSIKPRCWQGIAALRMNSACAGSRHTE